MFILRWRNIQALYDKKISPTEFIEKIKETIRLTIPHWDLDYGPHFYLKTELMLIYYIAMAYRMMGKTKEALELIEKIWNVYDTREVDTDFNVEERLLFLVFWKNLLTDCNEYERALEMAELGIRMCFSSGKGGKLNNFVTEVGWSLERSDVVLSEEERKAQCTQYYKSAMVLCKLFRLTRDETALRNYCNERGIELS